MSNITPAEARAICERFAAQHKVIFEDEGECGFGRECVGFKVDNWVDYNPCRASDYMPIPELVCVAAEPPEGVNAYHKHDCLAVLGRGDGAITELAEWVLNMERQGTVEIVVYPTGATGIQAVLSGLLGRAVMVREQA